MDAITQQFHFAQPDWLWGLFLPIFFWGMLLLKSYITLISTLSAYADKHLLPYLIIRGHQEMSPKNMSVWTLLWILAILTMAGPRWNYMTVDAFKPDSDLVILLDLSRSMSVQDIQPNRLVRSLQEIEDILKLGPDINIGLIGFASVAHIITPVTQDKETVHYFLSGMSTDMMQWQGSRLSGALDKAEILLSASKDKGQKSLLLISDGDFADDKLDEKLNKLVTKGIHLYVLGIGTPQGGKVPLKGRTDDWIRDTNGYFVKSALDEKGLRQLASAGQGIYLQADYLDSDTLKILTHIRERQAVNINKQGKYHVWEERYIFLVILMMIIYLLFFQYRKETIQ